MAVWTWGEGPSVYLVHGWGGRGGQLASFVAPLVQSGFKAVTFDAPGHGASPGARSSLPEFALALREVARVFGPAHGVIGHSLGASATALALGQGLQAERAVLIAPPADPSEWTRHLARRLGMTARVLRLMQTRIERRLGFHWSELDVPRLASRLLVPLLVIHDRDDAEVPYADGEAIAAAAPEARLVTSHGLGHRRILREPRLVKEAVSFVAFASRRTDAADEEDVSEQVSLERYLFDRDLRWKLPEGVRLEGDQ
jgi:pimeloyl-ACP methyl ester carboxylesterase